ncbi:MAG: phosphopantetheine adenylyltransferase [Candidatus Helarchaeota archaeon]
MLKLVGVAGTFGPLHKGHHALLEKAFAVGENVLIALTTAKMHIHKNLKEIIAPYEERKQTLEHYLDSKGYHGRYEIIPLDDPYGVAITLPEQEGIVVSEETLAGAQKINTIRKERGLPPLQIFTIKLIPAQDGQRLSSTRIRNAEIDSEGKPY